MTASVPSEIAQEIEIRIGSKLISFLPGSGGCINHSGMCKTDATSFFLKWNDRYRYPKMFEAEAKGLSLLKESTQLHVPEVIHLGSAGSYQFLLLEPILESRRAPGYWKSFGLGLAQLHRTTCPHFGLDHDNYIGSLPQINTNCTSWPQFFVEHRLRPQLRLAIDHVKLDSSQSKQFERLFKELETLLTDEPPSLLHGDLWGGNLMINASGKPSLIDPAVYYGNREVDLAMTTLFGGFDRTFLDQYNESFPLLPEYEERFQLYNLYPLLVHVNLFGGGYRSQVQAVLNRFV